MAMGMKKVLPVDPARLLAGDDPEWSHCTWRLLAEGDSWFSIGALNLFESANLLMPMAFSQFTAVSQLAHPGDTLQRMADLRADPRLAQLLAGKRSWRWSGLLLSCGGNDLIEAVQVQPHHEARLRLLRTAAEWGPASDGPARYVQPDGWATFAAYFRANLDLIFALRDRKAGPDGNRGRPVFMHTYAYPTPRPSGAGAGQGPWLYPAMLDYGVPKADWIGLARVLLDQLAELMLACAADTARYPGLHVFDGRQVALQPAALEAPGPSGHWVNEIHLTHAGCRRYTAAWCAAIEPVLLANP